MAGVEYTLWMQKTKEGSEVKDSLSAFGFAVCDIQWPTEETQEVATREWPGEHGEDAYIPPSGLKLKAYDLEVEFCWKGSLKLASGDKNPVGAWEAYKALRNWLCGIDGSGAELKVYDPYWRKGRTKVYVKKFGDFEPHRDNAGEVLSAKVTFRVADPMTEVVIEN